MLALTLCLSLLCALLAVPAWIFVVECWLSLLPRRRLDVAGEPPRGVVVMPAHNEAGIIAPIIARVLPELGPKLRLLVVADNCTDDTAQVARQAGADVLERHDPTLRGKGYALAFAFEALSREPPEVVLILDADCEVSKNGLCHIASLAKQLGRPVQADYLLVAPPDAGPKSLISAFAFLVRNRVRPLGLARLGGGCHLMGSGMAFPWHVIRAAPHQRDNLVEDLAMGLDLTALGYPAEFCADVRVTSELPDANKAAVSQRTRWEHGHLATIRSYVPKLLAAGRWLAALDLLVPPLALLMALLLAACTLTGGAALWFGAWLPFAIVFATLCAVGGTVLAAWFGHARSVLPAKVLFAVPLYMLWKLPMYAAFLVGAKQKTWVRTERGNQNGPKG